MTACEKDAEPTALPPHTLTSEASGIKRMEASLSGTVTPNPNSKVTVDYRVSFLYSQYSEGLKERVDTIDAIKGEGDAYSITLKNLTPGTTYYYCISANSGFNSVNGKILRFTTLSTEEPAVTLQLDEKTESSISLSGKVEENGGAEISARGFVYKEYVEGDQNPSINNGTNVPGTAGEEPGSFSAVLTENIKPSTLYKICAYATNGDNKTGYSEAILVKTSQLQIPELTTGEASDLTAYSALLHGTLLSDNGFPVTERGFCYSSESQLPTIEHPRVEASLDGKDFAATASGLEPLKTYYYRAYAKNEKGIGYGEVLQFVLPSVQTLTLIAPTVSEIGIETARVASAVNIPAGSSMVEKGICYSSTVMQPSVNEMHVADGTEGNNINLTLEGLTEGTTYYVRAYARSRDDVYYSASVEFRTVQTSLATLGKVDISDIRTDGATLRSSIIGDGGAAVTAKGFCYSKNTQTPTIENSTLPDASEGNAIQGDLDGLEEGTTYYVRAYATNKNGTGYSNTFTFVTVRHDPPTLSNLLSLIINDDNATMQAHIDSDGGMPVSEYGFCWSSTSSEPVATRDSKVTASNVTDGTFKAVLTGLSYNTDYFVRAYAVNAKGTAYSAFIKIHTSSSTKPTVQDILITNPTPSTLDVSATLTNDGGAEIQEQGFCYSTGGEPTVNDKKVIIPVGQPLTATLQGLIGYTRYYVRAYAMNKNGITYSGVTSGMTKKTDPDVDDPAFPGTE